MRGRRELKAMWRDPKMKELIDSLWREFKPQQVIEVVNEEIVNNTTNIYQSINQIIRSGKDENHESFLIENTTNAAETVISSWSVIPYNQQVGEFKAVVMVRNKVTNTIARMMSILSFDYSDEIKVILQSDLLTDAGMTLALGVNGSNQLYATVSGMPANVKRIHFCYERCALAERLWLIQADSILRMNMAALITSRVKMDAVLGYGFNSEALLTAYSYMQVSATLELAMSAELSNSEEWNLLAEFITNSPGTTTFDPAITISSGEYKWDVDGTEFSGLNLSTTLDGTSKTVKLYGKGTCEITTLDFSSDHIVGELDLSHDAFKSITGINLNSNSFLDKIRFPSVSTGVLSYIYLSSCNLSYEVDLSMFTSLSTATYLYFNNNASLPNLIFPASYSGKISIISLQNVGISHINLSSLTSFTNAGSIYLSGNLISLVSLPIITVGAINYFALENTGISGTIDISALVRWTTGATLKIRTSSGITNIVFPTTLSSGTITLIYLDGNNLDYIIMPSNWWAASVNSYGIIELKNNGMVTTDVNHWLVQADSVAILDGGYKEFNIDGSNAAPDTTSGGYNGISAKNSLTTKGLSVNVSS